MPKNNLSFSDQIRSDEGNRLDAYEDFTDGHLLVGFGHRVTPEDNLKKGDKITKEQSEALFAKDLKIAEDGARRLVTDFDKHPRDVQGALINMTYQMGVGGVGGFKKTLDAVNAGDYELASREMLNSKWAETQTPERAKRLSDRMKGAKRMAEGTARLEEALRNADAAGDTAAATRLAQELRRRQTSPPSGEGEQPQPTTAPPLGVGEAGVAPAPPPEAPAPADDPLAGIPTHIGETELTPEMRETMLQGQSMSPRDQRILSARIAGRLAASGASEAAAGVRGMGAGMFGLGDLAAAGATSLSGDMSFGEALEASREYRRALEEEFPLTSGLGEVVGAVAGGFGAVGLGAKALGGLGRAGQAVKKATAFAPKGGGAAGLTKNIALATAAGAVEGGITEGVTEGEVLPGLAGGAIAGPLGLGLAKGANITIAAIRRIGSDPAAKGLRALAKQLKLDPNDLTRSFLEFKAVTGKSPSMVELADPQARAELRRLIASHSSAVRIAGEEADFALRGRTGEFAEQVRGGKVTTTTRALQERRTSIAERQFAEIENDPVTFDADDVKGLLRDKDFRGSLSPQTKREIGDAMDVPAGEEVTLTAGQVNRIRIELNEKAGDAVGSKRVFKNLSDELTEIATGQSPAFGRAIDEFAQRSRIAESVALGGKIPGQPTSETVDLAKGVTRRGEGEIAAGLRVGARSRLADTARESLPKAATLAEDLSSNTGLTARLREVLPAKEVDRLQELGEVQARAMENLRRVSPAAKAEDPKFASELLREGISSIVVASGNTGGAFKAGLMTRLVNRLLPKLSKKATNALARDAFDPNKTPAVIAAFKKAGLNDPEIMDLFASTVAAANVGASAATELTN